MPLLLGGVTGEEEEEEMGAGGTGEGVLVRSLISLFFHFTRSRASVISAHPDRRSHHGSRGTATCRRHTSTMAVTFGKMAQVATAAVKAIFSNC